MASPKSYVSSSAMPSSEESSVVQDSNESSVASSSSGPLPSCVQVLDSCEPLVPSEPVASCSRATIAASTESLLPASLTRSESSDSDAEPQPSGMLGRRVTYYKEEMRSFWNMYKITKRLDTPDQCIQFAEERRLIPREKMCTYHKRLMKLNTCPTSPQFGIFQCRKSNCRTKSISRASGTWFENVRLSLNLVFQLMYMFSQKYTYLQVQMETAREDRDTILSAKTIADWFSYCREAIIIYELEHQDFEGKIGGPSKIVQIDESKFGKRKYNRGRHIEGHWVLGMIEDGSDDLRLEVCPDNDRSAESLVPLIQKHVELGTEIHTDFWRAYDCLPQHGYTHKKVNHSDTVNKFVAPDGTHTQRIESHWRNLKVKFNRDQYKGKFTDWLIEYSWRRKIRINHKDAFEELIKAIQYVYKIE